jgi:toxin ParE1/3/4
MAARFRPVIWADGASASLDEVVEYIAQDSPQAATDFLERALSIADGLSTLSERGRIVPEVGDATIRELFVGRYRLLYRVEETRIAVIGFLHGARDFAAWRREQGAW